MERSGVTPQVAADTSDLADLVKATGPFLILQLGTETDINNAAQRSEQRWRAVRDEARAQGTPEEVLAAVDPIVPDAHLEGQGLAVVATSGGLLHVEHGPRPPGRDHAALGTGAGIRVIEAGPALESGMGAILRWST